MGILLVFGVIFLLLICILAVAAFFSLISGPPESQQPAQTDTESLLVQDPHCGHYLAREDAVTESFDGQTLYFCSSLCQRQYIYLQKQRQARHNWLFSALFRSMRRHC